jgi:hypothetical protein
LWALGKNENTTAQKDMKAVIATPSVTKSAERIIIVLPSGLIEYLIFYSIMLLKSIMNYI